MLFIQHRLFFLSFLKALDNTLGLLGLVVELSEGVEALLHLLLQSCVALLGGGAGPFRLLDLGLDRLVPVALLRQVGLQPHHL